MKKTLLISMGCSLGLLGLGCGSASGEQDCVQATDSTPEQVVLERTKLKIDRDADWCRACVMGLKGYASCQRVYASDEKEERVALRQRALDKACLDAGYEAGVCPAGAVIGALCKGEKEPKDMPTAAQALQRFYEGKPIRQPEDAAGKDEADKKSTESQPKDRQID